MKFNPKFAKTTPREVMAAPEWSATNVTGG
jgi:hypothetical protein